MPLMNDMNVRQMRTAALRGSSIGRRRSQPRSRRKGGSIAVAASQTNVLILGGGGREHALCWKLRQSDRCGALYCAPGNAGILKEPDIQHPPIQDIHDHEEVVDFCKKRGIDLVVVGPEAPLVSGIVDDLSMAGVMAFGPSKEAAQLEGSKAFMKALCEKSGIPTGAYAQFTDASAAKDYIYAQNVPIVVKADGLAAGKGVIVCKTKEEAHAAVDRILLQQCFGTAGSRLVIEEYLRGEEASYFALIDGETVLPLTSAQDHKAVGEGDVGENTGGMGAYSPAPAVTLEMEKAILSEIVQPIASAMAKAGIPFKGVLFAGLMIHHTQAKLLEFNVRFGDPECQALMLRMKSDLLDLMIRTCEGNLDAAPPIEWADDYALTVVMASRGYPGPYQKGTRIRQLGSIPHGKIFHAGTALDADGQLISSGGRVLGVTALGQSVTEAQQRAYDGVDRIDWSGGFCRRDIGFRAIAREKGGERS